MSRYRSVHRDIEGNHREHTGKSQDAHSEHTGKTYVARIEHTGHESAIKPIFKVEYSLLT